MSRPTRTTELQDFQDRQIGLCMLNRSQTTAPPDRTIAQLISTPAEFQQIAVTLSWLLPVRSQVIVPPASSIRADLLNDANAVG